MDGQFKVISLPDVKLMKEMLDELFQKPRPDIRWQTSKIFKLTDLCLNTYSKIDGDIYVQITGTTVWAPISRFFAGVVMQALQNSGLSMKQTKIWIQHVHETSVIIKFSEVQKGADNDQ